MGLDAFLTLAVLVAVVSALALTRWATEAVFLGGLTVLLGLGVLDVGQALSGLSNPGVVTVAALFVVAEGLRQTGVVSSLASGLLGRGGSTRATLGRLLPPVMAVSALVNNTPVVAALTPAVSEWGRRRQVPASSLLMPMSFATILGGLLTLMGTSTNLVVAGMVQEALPGRADLHALGFLEIGAVGLPAAAVGLALLVVLAPWLLPVRQPPVSLDADPREYTALMRVRRSSLLVGRTIEEAGLRHLPGTYLAELRRGDHVLPAVSPHEPLQASDLLVFVGILDSVVDLQRSLGLEPATDQVHHVDGEDRCLVEAVVSNVNPLVGLSIRDGAFRTRYNAAVVAVGRHGERIADRKLGDVVLRRGDLLLLDTWPGFVEAQRNRRDFHLVSAVEGSSPWRTHRAPVAAGVLALMVAAVVSGALDMLQASLLAALAMVVTRTCRVSEARRAVDWSVLLTIAAALGISRAVDGSGLARFLAEAVLQVASTPMLALAVVYLLTAVLTELMTNNAAAALVFPMALSLADALGVSAMPFVPVIMVAASASFLTPIGYQTNLMVQGPGGYRFTDYPRLGLPLSLATAAVTLSVVPWWWGW